MNEIDIDKYKKIINKNSKNDSNKSGVAKYDTGLLIRIFIVLIVLCSLAIIYKSNNNLKYSISSYFFDESISFTKIKKVYDKYLGGLLPVKNDKKNTSPVFNEKLEFSSSSIYYDGVKLSVSENYLVPSLDEGMVVFVGEKENYGYTIIVENLDGINFWYSNISSTSLKLYDYVEKGKLVGEVESELYMVFSKDGNYLNYEDYIY